MKPLLLILLCSFASHQKIIAQDSVSCFHSIALQFGLNQVKEENLHPKVSVGTITMLSYGFVKRKNTWQDFNFTAGYSRLKTELEDLSKTINLQFSISYSKTYSIVKQKNFGYYIGPQGTLQYNASFFPNWDDSHLYWSDYFSIGIRNNFSFQMKNQHEWISSVSLPLFSVFSRPELYRLYKIDETDFAGIVQNLNSNLTAAHLNNVFFIRFETEYRFPVFKSKREAFTYCFDWRRVKHDEGNSFNQIIHQLGIKLYL